MSFDTSTIAQILILTVGIYMLLSFLRTTRGSGVVRAACVTILFLVLLLYGVAKTNEWLELRVVIKNIAAVLAVTLAIIFQPELRRGMVNLGDSQLLSRFLRRQRNEVLGEVSSAVVGMAKKKQGALIAFERQTPLDPYVENGVKVDSEVTRLILDTIFHHGSALHDGGVVIRNNRIDAAACIFPLTENAELSKSTGTRHRAALGLSEETDAVTVMVSEETGFISICKAGKLERRVARAELEQILTERIGFDEGESDGGATWASAGAWMRGAFTQHLGQKAVALVLGVTAFVAAYGGVHSEKTYDLILEQAFAAEAPAEPTPEKLIVLLPNKRVHLSADKTNAKYRVRVTGPRADIDNLANRLGGVLVVSSDLQADSLELSIEDVDWGGTSMLENLEMEWASAAPVLSIQHFDSLQVRLLQEHIGVDSTDLDEYYEPGEGGVEFSAEQVDVSGPKEIIAQLQSGELEFGLEPIVLQSGDRNLTEVLIELREELAQKRLEIEQRVYATLPIVPTEFPLGTLQAEVSLQSFDPGGRELVENWESPSRPVNLEIFARGVLPREAAGTESDERNRLEIQKFVEDNIRCFIDVGKVEGSDSREGIVETGGIKDWRTYLSDAFKVEGFDADAKVWVEITEGEQTILLKKREVEPSEPGAKNGGGEGT